LRERGFNVVVLGPPVQYRDPLPNVLLASQQTQFEEFDTSAALNRAAQDFEYPLRFRLRSTGVTYISVIEETCERWRCRVMYRGVPMTWDHHHLTEEGAFLLAEQVFPQIERAMSAN